VQAHFSSSLSNLNSWLVVTASGLFQMMMPLQQHLLPVIYHLPRAHPDVAAVLHAGFQKVLERPVKISDLLYYPSIGPNAYTAEEVNWCNATIDYLESKLDEEDRAKRVLTHTPTQAQEGCRPPAAAGTVQATSPAASTEHHPRSNQS
jgi:hypothetical protein